MDGFPGKVYTDCYPVVLDGAVVGWVESELAQVVVDSLRRFKVVQLRGKKQQKAKSQGCMNLHTAKTYTNKCVYSQSNKIII